MRGLEMVGPSNNWYHMTVPPKNKRDREMSSNNNFGTTGRHLLGISVYFTNYTLRQKIARRKTRNRLLTAI